MTHGDDSGLRFPPRVAPIQVVIVPISIGNWKETVLPAARAAAEALRRAGLRVELDAREEFTPGWKFAEYEMRGVPLRIEIGPRDVKAGQAVLVRRDLRTKEIAGPFRPARPGPRPARGDPGLPLRRGESSSTRHPRRPDLRRVQGHHGEQAGLRPGPWCGGEACEDRIKNETMATIRVIPLEDDGKPIDGGCVCCGGPALDLAHFARAY